MNRKLGGIGAAAVAAGLALAGCSSSPSTPAAVSSTGTTPSTAATSCPSAVQATLASATTPASFLVGPALDAKPLKGKTAWFISIDNSYPLEVANGVGFKAAATALGMKVQLVDAQGLTSTAARGIEQAVAAHTDAIILDAVPPEDVQAPLQAAQAAHIPVISAYEPPTAPGQFAAVVNQVEESTLGAWEGAEALSSAHCKGTVLWVGDTIYTDSQEVSAAIKAYVAKYCPTNCKFKLLDVPGVSAGVDETPDIQNAMRADPNISVLIAYADTYVPAAISAVQSLGSKIPIIGGGSDATLLQEIASGNSLLVATVGSGSNELTGWQLADQMVRVLLDKPVSPYDIIPNLLLTKQNLSQASLPAFNGFEAKYEAVWGL
jgi:ABC-type sugar transport system substrate-binding protein